MFGANRRRANAKSSMLKESNPDAACMYVQTSLEMHSDRHALLAALRRGDRADSSARGTAVETQRHVHGHNEKTGGNVSWRKEAKKFGKVPQQKILSSAITRGLSLITRGDVGEYTERVL